MTKAVVNVEQKRRIRRTALVLGLVALAFYVGFIWMAVSKAK